MYAILDLETFGEEYNHEGIIDIAIYRFDGVRVVDQLISLVNPEKKISLFVQKLTGITDNMVAKAPKFYQIAKRVIDITQDCIIVAHNAKFDYRILKLEYERLGFDFERKTLCTVELSKKLIPDAPKYNLDNLSKHLGIVVSDRHRANGDAQATVKLFKILLEKDLAKDIIKTSIVIKHNYQNVNVKYLDIISKMPTKQGIYYIHNKAKDIIYINKTNNIRKRINQILIGKTPIHKLIQKDFDTVSYQLTGNDLVANLKMQEELLNLYPKYNALKKRRKRKAPPEVKIEGIKDVAIIEKGRTPNENAVIFIKDGYCKGYGFYELNFQLKDLFLDKIITRIRSTKKVSKAIKRHLQIHKNTKLIEL